MSGTLPIVLCIHIYQLTIFSFTGTDYDNSVFFRTIPPNTTSRVLNQRIRIYNDSINEVEQLFALVGELGPEVPEEFACFRVTFGEAECRGRVGTTGIRIRDNDRKYYLRIKQLHTTHD